MKTRNTFLSLRIAFDQRDDERVCDAHNAKVVVNLRSESEVVLSAVDASVDDKVRERVGVLTARQHDTTAHIFSASSDHLVSSGAGASTRRVSERVSEFVSECARAFGACIC
jgi:hypothetical protein